MFALLASFTTIFALLAAVLWFSLRPAGMRPPAILALWLALSSLSLAIYGLVGNPKLVLQPGLTESTPLAEAGIDLSQLAEGVRQVEAKLAADPKDSLGWLMLARSYWLLERAADSALAYQNYHALESGDSASWLAHAEVLLAQTPPDPSTSLSYLERVLATDPQQPAALWLAGYAAALANDHNSSVDYWQRLLPLLAAEPESQAALQRQIDRAAELAEQSEQLTPP